MSGNSRNRSAVIGLVMGMAGVALGAQQQGATLPASRPAARETSRELACGAQSPLAAPLPMMHVTGGPQPRKTLFATGDTVIINAGSMQGLRPGQLFFVRRVVPDRYTEPLPNFFPVSVHTAGWVRIDEAHPTTSYATITHGCDGVVEGDYLEPFELPAAPTALAGGEPDFEHPGHMILADDRRQLAAPGDFVVLDRGSDHGVRPGQQLTVFRRTLDGRGPIVRVATATAMVIRPDSSLIRIDTALDPIYVGDMVAIHR